MEYQDIYNVINAHNGGKFKVTYSTGNVEVSLHIDYVVVAIEDIRSLMPLKNLSYGVITEIIATLKAKALDIANRDVMVNGKGKIVE